MNKIITALLISGSLFFTQNTRGNVSPLEQKEIIQHHIQIPVKIVSENQKVEVLFTTDKTGKVDFVLAKTSDAGLKANIEKQFSELTIPGLNPAVVNSVTLNFKLI